MNVISPLVRFGNQPSPAENTPTPVKPAETKPAPITKAASTTPKESFWRRNRDRFTIGTAVLLFITSIGGLVGSIVGRSMNHRSQAGQSRIQLESRATDTIGFLKGTAPDVAKTERVNSFMGELFTALASQKPEQAESLLALKANMTPEQAKATVAFFNTALAQQKSDTVGELKESFNQWFDAVPAKAPNADPAQLQALKQTTDQAFDAMIQNKKADTQLFWTMMACILGTVFMGIPFGALALYAAVGPMVK